MTLGFLVALSFAAAIQPAAPAQPVNARPAAAATAPDAERQAKGLKLAQAVQPREIAVTQSLAALDRQMVDTLLADGETKALEAEYPGIVRAMYLAARPILAADLEKSLPGLWTELAQVYALGLTSPQLDEATTFFEGAAGRKFLRGLTGNAQIKTLTRDITGPGDGTIRASSYTKVLEGAAVATVDSLTPAERGELSRFLTSPVGKALEGVAPEAMRVGLAWMNRADPESDARVEAAMIAAVEAFIESKPAPAPRRASPKGK